MKNIKFKTLLISLISLFTVSITAFGVYAWFEDNSIPLDSNVTAFTGVTEGAYFAYGNGTSDHPYGITSKRHLYNLAWLQYQGLFNNSADRHVYFELGENVTIDMAGMVLPPIGTETNPFNGVFDGNGGTISNLTVTNDAAALTQIPDSADYIAPEIVGFFGVVGKLEGESYSSETNSMFNFTLNNLTVQSKTKATLIGLAAGYVNAYMNNVKISGNATIDINDQVHNAKQFTNKLSDYGLVGYTTKEGNTGSSFSQELSKLYHEGNAAGGGQDDSWGGSFNIRRMNADIHAISGSKTGKYTASQNDMTLTMTRYSTNNPENAYNIYRLRTNTVIPLNRDASNNTLNSNTGYLTGSDIGTGNNGSPKSNSAVMDYIIKSVSTSSPNYANMYNGIKGVSYNASQTEILTYYNNGWRRVSDDYNSSNSTVNSDLSGYTKTSYSDMGFQKYQASREALDGILTQLDGSGNTVSANFIHGISFDTNSVDKTKTVTITTAKINGQTKSNYKVPIGCVDFNLKESGRINFFCSSFKAIGTGTGYGTDSYYLNSGELDAKDYFNDSFFALYHLTRNGSGTITDSKKIKQIWKEDGNDNYVYTYDGGTYSGSGTKVFDFSVLDGQAPVPLALYYFEIPVNAGEYALCGVSGQTKGAKLMYLDIGANALPASDETHAYSITTKSDGYSYPEGVDFAVSGSSSSGGGSFGVFIPASQQGIVALAITSNAVTTDITGSTVLIDANTYSAVAGYSYTNTSNFGNTFSVAPKTSTAPPQPKPSIAGGGERIIYIHLVVVSGVHEGTYDIRIIDQMNANNTPNEARAVYELDSGNGFATSDYSTIEALTTSFTVNSSESPVSAINLRLISSGCLAKAATLTRTAGSPNQFSTTYNVAACTDTLIDVAVEANGTTYSVTVETGYQCKVNGTTYPLS